MGSEAWDEGGAGCPSLGVVGGRPVDAIPRRPTQSQPTPPPSSLLLAAAAAAGRSRRARLSTHLDLGQAVDGVDGGHAPHGSCGMLPGVGVVMSRVGRDAAAAGVLCRGRGGRRVGLGPLALLSLLLLCAGGGGGGGWRVSMGVRKQSRPRIQGQSAVDRSTGPGGEDGSRTHEWGGGPNKARCAGSRKGLLPPVDWAGPGKEKGRAEGLPGEPIKPWRDFDSKGVGVMALN